MPNILQFSDTVTLELLRCPVCGTSYGIEKRMFELKCESGGNWYCPNGHSLITAKETTNAKVDRLERQLKTEQENSAWWRKEAESTARSLSVTRGVLTRTKNRIANGICPCCHRQFVNLARHMENQHPGYINETEIDISAHNSSS